MNDFIMLNARYKFKFNISIDKRNYKNLMILLRKTIKTNNVIIKGLLSAAGTDIAIKKISENQTVNNTLKKALADLALKNGIVINVISIKINRGVNDILDFELKFVIDNFSNVLEGLKSFVPKMTKDADYRKIINNLIDELKFSIPDTCKAGFIENIVNYSKKEICNIIEKSTYKKGTSVKINDINLKVEEIKK